MKSTLSPVMALVYIFLLIASPFALAQDTSPVGGTASSTSSDQFYDQFGKDSALWTANNFDKLSAANQAEFLSNHYQPALALEFYKNQNNVGLNNQVDFKYFADPNNLGKNPLADDKFYSNNYASATPTTLRDFLQLGSGQKEAAAQYFTQKFVTTYTFNDIGSDFQYNAQENTLTNGKKTISLNEFKGDTSVQGIVSIANGFKIIRKQEQGVQEVSVQGDGERKIQYDQKNGNLLFKDAQGKEQNFNLAPGQAVDFKFQADGTLEIAGPVSGIVNLNNEHKFAEFRNREGTLIIHNNGNIEARNALIETSKLYLDGRFEYHKDDNRVDAYDVMSNDQKTIIVDKDSRVGAKTQGQNKGDSILKVYLSKISAQSDYAVNSAAANAQPTVKEVIDNLQKLHAPQGNLGDNAEVYIKKNADTGKTIVTTKGKVDLGFYDLVTGSVSLSEKEPHFVGINGISEFDYLGAPQKQINVRGQAVYSDDQYRRIDTKQNGASLKIIRNELDDVIHSGCFNCQTGATALSIGKLVATATPVGDTFSQPHFKTVSISATVTKEGLEYNWNSFLSNLGDLAQSKTEGQEIILGKNLLMKNVVCEGSKQCNLMLARDQQSGTTTSFYEVYDPATNQVSKRVTIPTDIGTTLGKATLLTSSENADKLQKIQILIQQNRFNEVSSLLKNQPFDQDPALRAHLLKTVGIDINQLDQPQYVQKLSAMVKSYSDAQEKIQSLRQNYGLNLDEHGLPISADDQQKLNEILNKKRTGKEIAVFDLYTGARVDLARSEQQQLDATHQSCAGTASCAVSDEDVKEANQKLVSEVLRREKSPEGVEWKQNVILEQEREKQAKEQQQEAERLKDTLADAQKLGKKRDFTESDLTRNRAVLDKIIRDIADQEAKVQQLEADRKEKQKSIQGRDVLNLVFTGGQGIADDLALQRGAEEIAKRELTSLQQTKFNLEKRIEKNQEALKNINDGISGLTQDFKQPTSKLALLSAYGDDETVGKMIKNSDLPQEKKLELLQTYLGKAVGDKIKDLYANRYSSDAAFSQSEKQINEILGNGKSALRQAQNYAQYYGDIAGSKVVLDHIAATRPDLVDSPEWRAAKDSYDKAVDNRVTELKEIAQQNLQDKLNQRDGKESSIFGSGNSIADKTISALGTGAEKLGSGIRYVSMKTVAGTLYAAGGISQVVTEGQAGGSLLDAATALHNYDDAKHAQANAEINALNQEIKSYDKLHGLIATARDSGKEPDYAKIQDAFKLQAPLANLGKQMQGKELTIDDHAQEALYNTEQHALVAGGDELVTNEYRAIAAEYAGKSNLANVANDKVLQAGQIAEGSILTKEDLALYGDPIIDVTVDVTNLIPGVAFVKAGELAAKVAEVTKITKAFAEVGKAIEVVKDAGKLLTVSTEARLSLQAAKSELQAAQITKGLTVAERTAEISRATEKVTLAAQTAEAEYRASKAGKAAAFLSTPISSDLRAIEKLRLAAQDEQFKAAQQLQQATSAQEAGVATYRTSSAEKIRAAQETYQAATQKINDLDKAKQAYSAAGSDLSTLFEGTGSGKQRAVGPGAEKAQQALDDFQKAKEAYHTEKTVFGADKVSQATIDNVITTAKAAEKASFENRVSDAVRGAIGAQRVERNVEQLKAAKVALSFTENGKVVAEGIQEGSEEAKLVESTNKLLEDQRVVQRIVGDDASRLAKPENVPAPPRKLSTQEFNELEAIDKELEARGATYKINDKGKPEINIDDIITKDAKDLEDLKAKTQRVEQLFDEADKEELTKQVQARRKAEAVLADNDLQQVAKDVKNDLAAKANGKTDAGLIPEVAGKKAAELPKPLAKTEARIAAADDLPRPAAIEEAIDSRSAGTVSILNPVQQEGTEVRGLAKISNGATADENAQKVLAAIPEAGGEVKLQTINGNVYQGKVLAKDDNVIVLEEAGRRQSITTGKVAEVEVIETPTARGVSDSVNPCNLVAAAIYGMAPCATSRAVEVVAPTEKVSALSLEKITDEPIPELENQVNLPAEDVPSSFQRQVQEGKDLERLLQETPLSDELYHKVTLDSHGAQKLPVFENNLPPKYTLYEISMDRDTLKGLNSISYETGTDAISTQHQKLVAFAKEHNLPVTTLQKTTFIAVPADSSVGIEEVLKVVEEAKSATAQVTKQPVKLRVGIADNADTLMETRLGTKRSLEFADQTKASPTKYGKEAKGWYNQLPVEQKANVNDIFTGYDEALKSDFATLDKLRAEGKTEEYKQKLAQLAVADVQDAKFSNLPIVKQYQADSITGVRAGDAVVSTDGIGLGQKNKADVLALTQQNLPDQQLALQLGKKIDTSIDKVNDVIKNTYFQAVNNVNVQSAETVLKYDEIATAAKYPGGPIRNTDDLKSFWKWEFEHRGRFRGGDETFMTLRKEVLDINPNFAGTLQNSIRVCKNCGYEVRVGFKEVAEGESYAEAVGAADKATIASKQIGDIPVVVDRFGNAVPLTVSDEIPSTKKAAQLLIVPNQDNWNDIVHVLERHPGVSLPKGDAKLLFAKKELYIGEGSEGLVLDIPKSVEKAYHLPKDSVIKIRNIDQDISDLEATVNSFPEQAKVLNQLAEKGAAPHVYQVESTYYIAEKIEGKTLGENIVKRFTPEQRSRFYASGDQIERGQVILEVAEQGKLTDLHDAVEDLTKKLVAENIEIGDFHWNNVIIVNNPDGTLEAKILDAGFALPGDPATIKKLYEEKLVDAMTGGGFNVDFQKFTEAKSERSFVVVSDVVEPCAVAGGAIHGLSACLTGVAAKAVDVNDPNLWLRYPSDGADIELFPNQPRLLTKTSTEVKKILTERGIGTVEEGKNIFIEYKPGDPLRTSTMNDIATVSDKVGIRILGSTEPTTGGKIFQDVLPVTEIDGRQYRILKANEQWLGKNPQQIEAELNQVFVPSRVVEVNNKQYVLMPIIENIDHPTGITKVEFDDFIGRLKSTGLNVDTFDIGGAGKDINMVRYNGKIYLSDAGDVIFSEFGKVTPERIQHAEEALSLKIGKEKAVLNTPVNCALAGGAIVGLAPCQVGVATVPAFIPESPQVLEAHVRELEKQNIVLGQSPEKTVQNMVSLERPITKKPGQLFVYHNTHAQNLEGIIQSGGLEGGRFLPRLEKDLQMDAYTEINLPEHLRGQGFKRSTAIYATPRERGFAAGVTADEEIKLKFAVDPENAIVVNSEEATRAQQAVRKGDHAAFQTASQNYWKNAVSLEDFNKYYILEDIVGSTEIHALDIQKYLAAKLPYELPVVIVAPEVLIPQKVSTDVLEIVDYSSTIKKALPEGKSLTGKILPAIDDGKGVFELGGTKYVYDSKKGWTTKGFLGFGKTETQEVNKLTSLEAARLRISIEEAKLQAIETLNSQFKIILAQPKANGNQIMEVMAGQFNDLNPLFEADAGVAEGYTIRQHNNLIYSVYNDQAGYYLPHLKVPEGVELDPLMKATIALHDIGKPEAIAAGNKLNQHLYTIPILEQKLRELGFSEQEVKIAKNIVDNDALGELAQKVISPKEAYGQLTLLAKNSEMDIADYYELQKLFFTSDAASYPVLRKNVFNQLKDGKLIPVNSGTAIPNTDFVELEKLVYSEASKINQEHKVTIQLTEIAHEDNWNQVIHSVNEFKDKNIPAVEAISQFKKNTLFIGGGSEGVVFDIPPTVESQFGLLEDAVIKVRTNELPKLNSFRDQANILEDLAQEGIAPKIFSSGDNYYIAEKVEGNRVGTVVHALGKSGQEELRPKLEELVETLVKKSYNILDFHGDNIILTPEGKLKVIDTGLAFEWEGHPDVLRRAYSDRINNILINKWEPFSISQIEDLKLLKQYEPHIISVGEIDFDGRQYYRLEDGSWKEKKSFWFDQKVEDQDLISNLDLTAVDLFWKKPAAAAE